MPSADGTGVVLKEQRVRRRVHFVRVAVMGLVVGLVATAFQRCIYEVETQRDALLKYLHGYPMWGWAVLPVVGLIVGSLVGLLTFKVEPDASGSGIPHIKGVLLRVRRIRWARILPVKFVGGVLAVGVGMSMGREGPTVQMGAAAAAGMGRLIKVDKKTLPQMISCGAGAGLAAAFNAPLAGFVFVIEELRREMSPLTYAGALIAAICADIVTRAINGQLPSFRVQNAAGLPLSALPAVALLGVVMGLVAVVWNKGLVRGSAVVRDQKRVARWLVVGLVAMAGGLLGWWVPDALGGGHAVAERVLDGKMTRGMAALLVLLAAKFVFTVASYDSGAPGGIFAPMLVIGALIGEAFGRVIALVAPGMGVEPRAMAVMGMAALFSGSVRAPLTGIVLILEMTGNYEQLFAIAVASLGAYLVAEGLKDKPVYEALLESDLHARGLGEKVAEPVRVVMSVQHDSALENRTLREAKLPKGCLVVGIERRGLELLPTPDTRLMAGDHVTVLAPGEDPMAALEVVEMCRGA